MPEIKILLTEETTIPRDLQITVEIPEGDETDFLRGIWGREHKHRGALEELIERIRQGELGTHLTIENVSDKYTGGPMTTIQDAFIDSIVESHPTLF